MYPSKSHERRYYPTRFARIPDAKGREWREILLLGFVDVAALQTALAKVGLTDGQPGI